MLLAGLLGDAILAELASEFEVRPKLIAPWNRQASEGLGTVFSVKVSRGAVAGEAQIKALYAQIGQATIAREFLAQTSGRCAASAEKWRSKPAVPNYRASRVIVC